MLLMARKMMARDAAACGLISEVLPKQRLMSEVRACAPACRRTQWLAFVPRS